MVKVNYNFEEAAKNLLKELSGRARDVVERRFGIGSKSKRQTLESIGQSYKVTRERIRQIEAAAINKMRQSPVFSAAQNILDSFKEEFEQREKLWKEEEALNHFSLKPKDQNYAFFFLSLTHPFKRLGADQAFYHRWTIDSDLAKEAEKTISSFTSGLGHEPMSEDEIISKFCGHVEAAMSKKFSREAALSWLGIAKDITRNAFGEWGHVNSPLVKPSGMRDFAYLVLKKHGSPLHFREVAANIERAAQRPAHVQTVHNELIKDDRFILVGRGLYALSSWGYQAGTVKDIVTSVLQKSGPLSKEELIKLVQQERHVKENTILINLQNKSLFKKLSDGRFHTV